MKAQFPNWTRFPCTTPVKPLIYDGSSSWVAVPTRPNRTQLAGRPGRHADQRARPPRVSRPAGGEDASDQAPRECVRAVPIGAVVSRWVELGPVGPATQLAVLPQACIQE